MKKFTFSKASGFESDDTRGHINDHNIIVKA